MNGCFALRPTFGVISTDGIVPTDKKFDVPALFGRDMNLFSSFVSAWYQDHQDVRNVSHPAKFAVLYPPDFFAFQNPEQKEILERFAGELAHMLGTSVQKLSIADAWKKSPPVEDECLKHYLYNVRSHPADPETRTNTIDSPLHTVSITPLSVPSPNFVPLTSRGAGGLLILQNLCGGYGNGRSLFHQSHSLTSARNIGQKTTATEHQEMVKRIQIFKSWFLDYYMRVDEQDSIIVMPVDEVHPNFRDEYIKLPVAPVPGLRTTYLSPFIGAPELVIPSESLPCRSYNGHQSDLNVVGQLSYKSRISGRSEFLPVVVSLMGPPGSDLQLVDVALQCLKKNGRPTRVQTGRELFGQNSIGL